VSRMLGKVFEVCFKQAVDLQWRFPSRGRCCEKYGVNKFTIPITPSDCMHQFSVMRAGSEVDGADTFVLLKEIIYKGKIKKWTGGG